MEQSLTQFLFSRALKYIVIAVDLQHDAHLMQQDLLSFNVSEENSENGDSLPWHARLKERLGSITTRRAVTAPTATEIMTTSIRGAGEPPCAGTAWQVIRPIF